MFAFSFFLYSYFYFYFIMISWSFSLHFYFILFFFNFIIIFIVLYEDFLGCHNTVAVWRYQEISMAWWYWRWEKRYSIWPVSVLQRMYVIGKTECGEEGRVRVKKKLLVLSGKWWRSWRRTGRKREKEEERGQKWDRRIDMTVRSDNNVHINSDTNVMLWLWWWWW